MIFWGKSGGGRSKVCRYENPWIRLINLPVWSRGEASIDELLHIRWSLVVKFVIVRWLRHAWTWALLPSSLYLQCPMPDAQFPMPNSLLSMSSRPTLYIAITNPRIRSALSESHP
jgi:hypothetical protein